MTIALINAQGHDPQALLDYAISLQDYLRTGESVSTVAWTSYESDGRTTTDPPFVVDVLTSASPQAASVIEDGVTYTSCEIVWLTVAGADATAKNARIGDVGVITLSFTTSDGRQDDRSFKLKVKAR